MTNLLTKSLVSLVGAGIIATGCDDNPISPRQQSYFFCNESERLSVTATADRPQFSFRVDDDRYVVRVYSVRPTIMRSSGKPGHMVSLRVNNVGHTGSIHDSLPDTEEIYLRDGTSLREVAPADSYDAVLRITRARGYIPADSTQTPGSVDFTLSWCE